MKWGISFGRARNEPGGGGANGDIGLPGGGVYPPQRHGGLARGGGLPPQRLGGLPGGGGRSFKHGMAQLNSYNPIGNLPRSVFPI